MRLGMLVFAAVLGTAEAPGPKPLPDLGHPARVVVIPIQGTIDLGVAPFLSRILGDLGPNDLVVLDINTLGGRLDAAILMRDALLHSRAKTVCWVNPRAISAGALISLACDVIAVSPGATIGAATPVEMGQGETKTAPEKVVSYMRKEMRATAEAKGRNGVIGEAMVDPDVEIPGLDEKGKLLTLDGGQALEWGVASVKAADEAELWKVLGIAPARIDHARESWAETLARFLSDPMIASLLMTLGMLGILIEFYSPGHGVALTAGLACLGLFFFGHLVVKLAGWEELVLFAVGVGLIAVEVFVPGHILPGVFGGLCVAASLVMALLNLDAVPFQVAWDDGLIVGALAKVSASLLFTVASAIGLAKVLPRTAMARKLVLDAAIRAHAAPAPDALVGQEGQAETDLRPAGKARFGDKRVAARAERGFIEAGTRVVALRHDGAEVVVKEST